MSESEDSLKQLEDQYRGLQPQYARYCIKLKELVQDLLDAKGIRYQVVEERAKTVDSLMEKVQREGKKYESPLEEVSDLAGIRIILYYEDDVDVTCALIRGELDVDEEQSEDKRGHLMPDRFGYLSVHLIAQLAQTRMNLPEWKSFQGLVCEIQVRSVLQHSWAAISHALQYKRQADVPVELQRRLFRVSGLLELADEQFTLLRTEQEELSSRIAARVEAEDPEIAIHVLSIKQFIDASDVAQAIILAGRDAGFGVSDFDFVSDLIALCATAGIEDVGSLSRTLDQVLPHARSMFGSMLQKPYEPWTAPDDFLIALAIIAGHTERISPDTLVAQGWDKGIAKIVLEVVSSIPLNGSEGVT